MAVVPESLEARVLFAAGPTDPATAGHAVAVRQLARVDAAVEASLGDAGLLGAWSPLDSLTPPGAAARSYLDLVAYTPFDINFGTLHRALAGAPSRAALAAGKSAALPSWK